jgi:hypothetical protein
LQLVVTGEIPDVRIARVARNAVHPTVARLPIAIAFVKSKIRWQKKNQNKEEEGQS